MMDLETKAEEYTPKQRLQRRPVSMSTRRRSTLLYLEKYGLDQPNWHLDKDNSDSSVHSAPPSPKYYTQEPESYVDSFAPNTQTIVDAPVKRPTSIRNSVQTHNAQKRPARFIKPDKLSTINVHVSVPTEFRKVHQLVTKYASKLYMEGYLYKRNDLNSDGSSSESKKWKLQYVELSGAVLVLWDAEQEGDVIPRYINITDASVQMEDRLAAETKENLFSLNSAGANRYLFQAHDPNNLQDWILAIRLSCFECARIQEIYTFRFISRPQFKQLFSTRQHVTKCGFLQVRFPGATGWKKFWAVVTNHKIEKRLFNKKLVPTDGKILFYESRKSKHPIMTLEQVVQAYTVYPESPKLVSTLFKIEGYNGKKVSAALIMATDTNDMVHWLTSIYDTFQLYGRPKQLLDDPQNPQALNYGDVPTILQCPYLMLDMQDVAHVDTSHDSNLLTNKKEFTSIFNAKLSQGLPQSSSPSLSASSSSSTTVSSINEIQPQNKSTMKKRNSVPSFNIAKPTQLRSMTLASDVSDSSDDESLYQFGSKPTPKRTISKSSSSISTPESYLPPVTDLNDHFSASVMSEVKQKQLQKNWESASVDARMVSTPAASVVDDDDDDDIAENYVLQQNILLNQDRAKKLEHHARATGQPYVQLSMKKTAPRGLVGAIDDTKRTRGMSVDEQMTRMMMEQQRQQQILMQQQYMQQGMMPMMVPVMDPRMMPVQPMMMYDPRISMPMMQQSYFPSTMSSPNLSPMSTPNLSANPMSTPNLSVNPMSTPNLSATNQSVRRLSRQQQQIIQNDHRKSAFRKSAMMSSSSSLYSAKSNKK